MILLRLISWPYARRHLLRWLLTISGIALGVGVFVSTHTANESVRAAFEQTIDRIAGATQLQVSAGEPGFDEEILDKVQGTAGVRAAAPVIEATASVGTDSLLILGVDMLGDRKLRSYDLEGTDDAIDDPLVFLAQPDSLLITRAFAEKKSLRLNSRLPMLTMDGEKIFIVRGIMKPGGLASAYGGSLAIMDIYSAQKVFGRGRKFDRIDLALEEGATLSGVQAKLQGMLGPGFEVEPPSSRGQQFEATSRTYTLASNITGVFALFIGMFIIYNTFAVAVTQRRSEIGILRALGAERSQIRKLFLVESAVAGLGGTLCGIAFGILIARAIAGYIGSLLSEVYGLTQNTGSIAVSPGLLAEALFMGVVTSLIAALVPARAASHVDPVKALQKGGNQTHSVSENRSRRLGALVCAVLSAAALALRQYTLMHYAGFLLAAITAVLLTPMLSLWLARLSRVALAWIMPVEGTLAADSLTQAPRRTSGTVAALMLSVALVISLGGLARSSYQAISEWIRLDLNPDLFITPAESITAHSFVFPGSLADALRGIKGIADVHEVRGVRVMVRNARVMLVSLDIEAFVRRASLRAVEGDPKQMERLTARGEGLIASENFARLHGVKLGEVLSISAPSGTLRLPVTGIVRDFSDQQGSVIIARKTFIKYWHDDSVNLFRVYLNQGARDTDVRQRILEAYGTRQRLFVLTNRELRNYVLGLADQWFGLTYVQIAVAVLVAVLGIVNALSVSILDRRRELGVLQAVGGLRRQIRHTVWTEAAAIGFIGLVLGLLLGAIELYYSIQISSRDLTGTDIAYTYPWGTAAILFPVILGAAFLAALGPAESAVRGSLVEALEYE